MIRPNFNSQVGVPIRWVNIPGPTWSHGRGSYRTAGYGAPGYFNTYNYRIGKNPYHAHGQPCGCANHQNWRRR